MSSATAPRVQPVHFYPPQSTLQFGIRAIAGRFNRARWWSIGITQMLFFGLCWAQWQGRPLVSFDLVRQQVHLFGALFGPQDLLLLTLLMIGGVLALGARATSRLQQLMNAGPFSLEIDGRATDKYGRALRIVTRDGQSIGQQLVDEGLARTWDGRRHPWC